MSGSDAARLRLEAPGRRELLHVGPGETLILGSGARADLRVEHEDLAERHLALTWGVAGLQAVDLGGPRPVTRRGEPLPTRQPVPLRRGDRLCVGPCALEVESSGAEAGFPAALEAEYKVGRQLGEGAMGRVFAARRRRDGLKVAVKLLKAEFPPGSPAALRFRREGRAASKVESPFVVKVLDVRVEDGRAYVVMERVKGPTAHELLRKGSLAIPLVLKLGQELAAALEAAANAGVVHRDVKPGNVLLSSKGVTKLVDFGTAKCLEDSLASLTESGQGMGTPGYLAPEQVAGARHADPRADVYGLGATLYHLLSGQAPHPAASVDELIAVFQSPPKPLRELRPACPLALAELVHAMLELDPSLRLPAWRVREELEALQASQG